MKEFTCIVCPKGCRIFVDGDRKFTGAGCRRGNPLCGIEMENPTRMITTVRIRGGSSPAAR